MSRKFNPKRKKLIIGVVIILLLVSWNIVSKNRAAERNKPTIETAKVEIGTVSHAVSATGVLQPLTTVDVKSNAGGRVDVLAVDVGSIVQPGQLIGKIDPTDSRTALDQAVADLSASDARLSQARENLALQQEQSVLSIRQAEESYRAAKARLAQAEAQAEVQPKLTKASLAQAEASYGQARAALEKSQRNHDRQKELLDKGFISESQFDVAKLELENAKTQVASAQASLANAKANAVQDRIRQQEVAAARASLAQAHTALQTARSNVRQNRIRAADIRSSQAQIVRNQAQVDNARAQLDYTTITAPRAGVILKKYVEVGTIVMSGRSSFAGSGQGTSLVQLGDLSRMFVLASVDETDIASVEVGQMVDITLDAFPSEIFEGRVTKIDPQTTVSQNVTTIPVTVEIDDPDARLKPGMNATCSFIVERKEDVLIVPSEAVVEENGRNTVTVMVDDKKMEREVEVGIAGDDGTEIISGLKEGDVVVTAIIEPESKKGGMGMGGPFGMPGGGRRGFGKR